MLYNMLYYCIVHDSDDTICQHIQASNIAQRLAIFQFKHCMVNNSGDLLYNIIYRELHKHINIVYNDLN